MTPVKTAMLIATIAIISFSRNVHAQEMEMKTPQERAHQQTRMMQKRLNLTQEQTATISQINLTTANSMDSLIHTGIERQQMGQGRRRLVMMKDMQLKTVFTTEQFKRYQAIEEERKQKMIQRRQIMQQGQNGTDNTGNN